MHGRGLRVAFTVCLLPCIAAPRPVAAQLAACADSLFESLQSAHGIPALAVAVTRGDTLLFNEAKGDAHIEFGVRVTPSTLFQLSSTTRLLTGVLAMRLAARRVIDLDAPVTEVLHEAPPSWARLTVRHLLSGTGGLSEVSGIETGLADVLGELYAAAPAPAPGARWLYSLAEYAVLQSVLERAGGRPLEELMRGEVFAPAGMTSARYWATHRDVVRGAATGYYPDSTVMPRRYVQREFDFPAHLFSAAGAAASVEDLLRFDRALRDGRLFPVELRDALWSDARLEDGRTVSYGLGWDTKTHAPGFRSAGHSGGYLTTFRTYPGSDLTVIVLANGFLEPFDPDDVATAFAAVWHPAIVGFERPRCRLEQLRDAGFW